MLCPRCIFLFFRERTYCPADLRAGGWLARRERENHPVPPSTRPPLVPQRWKWSNAGSDSVIYRGPTSRKRFNTRVVNRVCTGLSLLIPPLLSPPPPLLLFLPVGISGNASVICATGYRFHLHIPIGSFVHCYLRCHVIPWSNSLTRSNPGSPLHSISRNVVLGHRSRYLDNRFFFFF